MLEEREVIVAIGAAMLILYWRWNRRSVASIPNANILFLAFALFASGLICSVLEVFDSTNVINTVQHGCASLSMVFLAVWSWMTFMASSDVEDAESV